MKPQPAAADLKIIRLTENAITEIKRRLAVAPANDELGLRLGVKGGGCSGLSYVIDMGKMKPGDHIITHYGFPIYIDTKSGLYLEGVELDYESGFMGSGFKFKNPNASNTCGCGESFSL